MSNGQLVLILYCVTSFIDNADSLFNLASKLYLISYWSNAQDILSINCRQQMKMYSLNVKVVLVFIMHKMSETQHPEFLKRLLRHFYALHKRVIACLNTQRVSILCYILFIIVYVQCYDEMKLFKTSATTPKSTECNYTCFPTVMQ